MRLPDPSTAFPAAVADGLRTMPPRENGGNMDVRDLGPGATLLLPVHVDGALLSAGDLHFAQGDGEISRVRDRDQRLGHVPGRAALGAGVGAALPRLQRPGARPTTVLRDHRDPSGR